MATIRLLDDEETILKKLKRAQTDSENSVHYDKENKPGISNLMGIYAAITKDSYETIEQRYVGQGYGTFKKDVAELLIDTLRPLQERYNELIDSPELDHILDEGAAKAREKASKTYRDVELAMGLHRK